jgi:hypothetical protein
VINKDTVELAIGIAQEFDVRKMYLEAIPGTPLDALTRSCCLSEFAQMVDTKEYTPDAAYIEAMSNRTEEGLPSKHDIELDAFSVDISAAVASHLNFAKNVVRPIISELVSSIETDIAAIPVNVQYNAEVIVVDMPEPMVSASFRELIEGFSNRDYFELTNYVNLKPLTAPEIIELMSTGYKEVDAAIAVFTAKLGDEFITTVYNAAFTAEPSKYKFSQLISDADTGLAAAVILFLLSNKLYDNPPKDTNISLANYNEAVSDFRIQSAIRIGHGYEDFNRNEKLGLVIIKYNKNQVYVSGSVYRAWLEQGGNDAQLFGSVLSSTPAKYAVELNTRRSELVTAWEQANRMLTATASNERFITYRSIVMSRTISTVNANMKSCFEAVANDAQVTTELAAYIQFTELLKAFMETTLEDDFKNLWSLALKIVCRTVFFYTDAEKILGGIEEACAVNTGIEIREAALLSLIKYVTDYVCNQMQLKSV